MDSSIVVALISAAVTMGNVFLTNIIANRKKASEHDQHIADGLQCLLRAEIIHAHDKYMKLKYCPIYVKESINREYKAYHALGGNDVATELCEDLKKLPETDPNTGEA